MSKNLMIMIIGVIIFFVFAPTINSKNTTTYAATQPYMTFEQRVSCQTAIEKVYWDFRIWPKGNPLPKPSFESIMPEEIIKAKVEDMLKKSNALNYFWHNPITANQLQTEMERMAQNTKKPEILKKLWESMDNDPHMIAECFVHPFITDTLIKEFYASSQSFYGGERISFDKWWSGVQASMSLEIIEPIYVYHLPIITSSLSNDDSWISIMKPAVARRNHTAVWTGTEMIIWGGEAQAPLNTGKIYNPAMDSWIQVSAINVPSARENHAAVWTGTEMIIWGGSAHGNYLNDGGRYNPAIDSWTSLSNINAPDARDCPTAIWTGTEMIICSQTAEDNMFLGTGGKYNPVNDSWTGISDPTNEISGCGAASKSACKSAVDACSTPSGISAPTSGTGNCSGALIFWLQDPTNWGDDNIGTRTYDVLRDGTPLATGLAYGTNHYTDTTCTAGANYTYSVRYNNGCGLSAISPGSIISCAGVAPVAASSNASDLDVCADTGVRITWNQEASSWGTGGPHHYEVLRNGTSIAFIWYFNTIYIDTTGTNNMSYTYAVRYVNGCSLYDTTFGTPATDFVSSPPSGLTNNTASDLNPCADTGVRITWAKDPASWNDNGYGTRTYDVLRDGTVIATGIAYNTTTFVDTAGSNDVYYTYTVRYNNGCAWAATTSPGAGAADIVDAIPCPTIGNTLNLSKIPNFAVMNWNAASCSDLASYRIYGTTFYSAPFPSGWVLLSSPQDPLNSPYIGYRITTVDTCGNESM